MRLGRGEGLGVISSPQILLHDGAGHLLVAEIHARDAGAHAAGGAGRCKDDPFAGFARAGLYPRLLRHALKFTPARPVRQEGIETPDTE